MRFCDMTNANAEMVCAIDVSIKNNGCELSWMYPINYSSVKIFVSTADDNMFDEKKALNGEYKMFSAKKPANSLFLEGMHSFIIFPVIEKDGEEILVRQNTTFKTCSINVEYKNVTRRVVVREKSLFKKELTRDDIYLVIESQADLPATSICYRVGSDSGVFCLPFDLKCGVKKEVKVSKRVDLFAPDEKIILTESR